ncbi:MAG: LysR substrate-binding domain-containing protein [Arenibacterium sp.]
MSRKLPPLNALRAFEAAGRHQSFSRAAEELVVSHSAISRHVRGLEARLGVQLFRDLPRGVELTPVGARYLDRIWPALDQIAEATEDLSDAPAGRVTVNSETLFAERFVIPRLGRFQRAFPEIEVRLDASALLTDVDRYEADLAIRFANRGTLDVPSDILSLAQIFPYASPEMMAKIKAPRDLLSLPRLRDRSKNIWRDWFAKAGVSDADLPEETWRLRSSLAFEAAVNGLGVYLGSSECVSFEIENGRLIRCFDIGLWGGSFHLVYGSRGVRRTAVKAFRDWLLDETQAFRNRQDAPNLQPTG